MSIFTYQKLSFKEILRLPIITLKEFSEGKILFITYSKVKGFIFAILLVTLAGLSSAALPATEESTTIILFSSVIFSTWYGGISSGILATIYAIGILEYYFIQPINQFKFDINSLIRLVIFFSSMLFMTSVIATKRRAERIIYNSAYIDQTTNLANKRSFLEKLNTVFNIAKRNNKTFSILFIDLDKFKLINDVYGHEIGDLLLQKVACRLTSCVRTEDIVSRFGGDEFVILLSELYKSHDAKLVAEKITNVISIPFEVNNHLIKTSVSIGIATYPDNGETEESLIRNADSALYIAKKAGRNNYKASSLH